MTKMKNGAPAPRNAKLAERRMVSFADMLTESEIDKSAVVFAAKAITDKLQSMAENAAKMEANDIMPMLDTMRENFGPQIAQNFEKITVGQLRDVTTKLRQAKDAISNEILRMEKSVNGEDTSDMAMDSLPDDSAMAAPGGDDMAMGDEAGASDDITKTAPELDLGHEDDTAAKPGAAPSGEDNSNEDLSDLFHEDGLGDSAAAGRPRKESFQPRVAALSESKDPDAMVLREFRVVMREGKSPTASANIVAARFGIDFDGVLEIVREAYAAQKDAPETSRVFTFKNKTKGQSILNDFKATSGITFRMTANGASVSGSKREIERIASDLRDC